MLRGRPRLLSSTATRGLALVMTLAAVLVATAGCGSSSTNALGATADGLDAVTISGEVGSNPQVEWTSMMAAPSEATSTLVTGTGPALADGDSVLVNYWLGNGYTEQSGVLNTFGPSNPAADVTVGVTPTSKPQTLADLMSQTVSTFIKAGDTVGSRIAVTIRADQLFGDNVYATPFTAKNIGNEDPLLLIIDIGDQALSGPDGTQRPRAPWAPKVVATDGVPTRLDFTGTPALGGRLKVAYLRKGTGAPVRDKQLIVADYLGQVAGASKPFDESFSSQPFATPIGVGSVIKGWDQALVGVPVGSRVMLGVPPDLGYGDKAQSKIPAGSTLYFVIDVLAAG